MRLWRRVQSWPLPPALRFLAETELRLAPPSASLNEVLHLANIRYEAARRQAAGQGLPPPGKFIEALRLVRAVSVLQRGEQVQHAAQAFGFRDAGRFGRRMRHHFGITPSEARKLGPAILLNRLE